MFCTNCGYNNAPGALLCAQCGVSLAAGSGPSEPTQPGGAPPPPGQPYPPAPGQPAPLPPGYPAPGAPSGPDPYGGQPGYPPGGPPGFPPGPPGYGTPPPFGAPGPPGGKKSQKGLLIGVLAVLVVLALAAGAFLVFGGKDDDKSDQVVLEPIGQVQQDDFAGQLDLGQLGEQVAIEMTDMPALEPQVEATLAGTAAPGSEPGLYGGSQDAQVCDVEQLLSFLQDEGNSDKATVWAETLDIPGGVSGIPDYIGGLTAVRLRFDTRVTNHGFRDGQANAFQSVLQAGTAVMVDANGVPRVKCACGNPLAEPTPLGDVSASDASDIEQLAQNPDDAWDGFDVTNVVVVQQGDTVENFIMVQFEDGAVFRRPVGSNGDEDTEFNDRGDLCDPGGKLEGSPTCSEPELGTGDVQLTLRWDSDADLDLSVTEPGGGFEIAFPQEQRTSPSGGSLDVDSNVDCVNDGGVENIFWPENGAPTGTYTIGVTGYELFNVDTNTDCGSGGFTLTIRVAGQPPKVIEDTVAEGETKTYTFDA